MTGVQTCALPISAHFFLANSLEQLYRPSKKGEPQNDALLTDAVQHYQMAADRLGAIPGDDNKKLAKLSMEYLVAAYGPDKLADPAKAEELLKAGESPRDTSIPAPEHAAWTVVANTILNMDEFLVRN